MISTSLKRNRRIIVYGSVARYGPQSVVQHKMLITWNDELFVPKLQHFLRFKYNPANK